MKGALFDGIDGTKGSIPVGAIVTVGMKGARGNPERTNRFFLLSMGFDEIHKGQKGGYRNLRHPPDPRFVEFNSLKDEDRRASVLRGNLLFPLQSDSLNYHLLAQQLAANGRHGPKPHGGGTWETPPRGMPACIGDGKRAERFDGLGADDKPSFISIPCPNRLCPFRQGEKKICGAFGRLYFRLRWPDGNPLTSTLVRYTSHGWDTVENMVGVFEAVAEVADGLGMPRESWSYSGLPFDLAVGMKKQPDKGRSFPVVSFSVDDIPAFLRWQVENRKFLLAAPRSVALIGEGNEHDEASLEGLADAAGDVSAGFHRGIPGNTPAEPEAETEVIDAEPIETPAQAEPPPYEIDAADPRSPGQRLLDYGVDALRLSRRDVDAAAQAAAGCPIVDVPLMFEAAVAAELHRRSDSARDSA